MRYFTIEELSKSATARRLGIDNTPTPIAKANLEKLVDKVLDPLRAAYGRPIIVTSGYRSRELNSAVGGAATSQHRTGEAADIEAATQDRAANKRLYDLIIALNLPYDQLINEFDYDWVHVSFGARNRRQRLRAYKDTNGRTKYQEL